MLEAIIQNKHIDLLGAEELLCRVIPIGANRDGLSIQPRHHKRFIAGSGYFRGAVGKDCPVALRGDYHDAVAFALVAAAENRHSQATLLQRLSEPNAARRFPRTADAKIA